MSEIERLKAELDAAQEQLKRYDTLPDRRQVANRVQAASQAYYTALRAEAGREIVARLVGQTIVEVSPRWTGEAVNADGEELDAGVAIVLSNGVEIRPVDAENWDGRLEVSPAYESPQSADAVDPVNRVKDV